MVLSAHCSKDYDILELVGEGTSGQVYKGIHKSSKEVVALKVIKSTENLERSAKDEIGLLRQLSHVSCIIPLKESVISPADGECVLVFPYYEHDLSGLLSENRLSLPQVKCYLRQLLLGLQDMHKSGFMHRDIKAANLLLNNKGQLVIADLGTAVGYIQQTQFSNKVVTLWYRAPELLLGSCNYGPEIDVWSVGCVFIELMTSRNFLPGPTEQQQLEVICKLCGTPNEENCPGVTSLPNFSMLDNIKMYTRRLEEVLLEQGFTFPPEAMELLHSMLCIDPKKRITAQDALLSPFFSVEPLPLELHEMPSYEPVHVLDAARKREKERPAEPPAKRARPSAPAHGSQHHSHNSSHNHQHHNDHNRHHNNNHNHHASHLSHPPHHSHGGSHNPHYQSSQHRDDHRSPQHSPSNQHLSPTSQPSPSSYHHSPERSSPYSPQYTSPPQSEWSPRSEYTPSPPTSPHLPSSHSSYSHTSPNPPSSYSLSSHTSPPRHVTTHRRPSATPSLSSSSTLRQSSDLSRSTTNSSSSAFPKWKPASESPLASSGVIPPATPSAAPTAPPPTPAHLHSSAHVHPPKRTPNFQVHIPTAVFLRGDWNADYANGSAPPAAKVATPREAPNAASIFFPTPLTSLKMSGSFSDSLTITPTGPITPIILSPAIGLQASPSITPGSSSLPFSLAPLLLSSSSSITPSPLLPVVPTGAISPTIAVSTPITPIAIPPPPLLTPQKPNPFLQPPQKKKQGDPTNNTSETNAKNNKLKTQTKVTHPELTVS